MNLKNNFLIIFFCFCACMVNGRLCAEPVKLAIIDVNPEKRVPEQLLDLLCVEISNQPSIDLLEREQLEQIFKEQKIWHKNKLAPNNIVKTGQLTKSDIFLLLNQLPETKKSTKGLIHVRLVETKGGIKLLDIYTKLNLDDRDFKSNMQKLIARINKQVKKLPLDDKSLTLIGLTGFACEDISNKWDWLGEFLTQGVEKNLTQHPQIIVLERQKVADLRQERFITSGLPQQIKSGMLLLSGSFRIIQKENEKKVSINIIPQGAGKEKAISMTIPLAEISSAPQLIANKIAAKYSGSNSNVKMDNTQEAKMLIEEAKYLAHQPEKAVELVETALALTPEDPLLHDLLIDKVNRYLWQMKRLKTIHGYRKFMTYCRKAMHSIEYMIRKHPEKLTYKSNGCDAWYSFSLSFKRHIDPANCKNLKEMKITPSPLELGIEFNTFIYPQLRNSLIKQNSPDLLRRFIYATKAGLQYSGSFKEVFKKIDERTQDTLSCFKQDNVLRLTPYEDLCDLIKWQKYLRWHEDDTIRGKALEFLTNKLSDKNPHIAFMAARTLLTIFQRYKTMYDEYETAKKAAEVYCDYIVKGILHKNPPNIDAGGPHLPLISFDPDTAKDKKFKSGLYKKLLAPLFENPNLALTKMNHQQRFCSIAANHNEFLIKYYIELKDYDKAADVMKKCIIIYDNLKFAPTSRYLKEQLASLPKKDLQDEPETKYFSILLDKSNRKIQDAFFKVYKPYNKSSINLRKIFYQNGFIYAIYSCRHIKKVRGAKFKYKYAVIKYKMENKEISEILVSNASFVELDLASANIADNMVYLIPEINKLLIFDFNKMKTKYLSDNNAVQGKITSSTFFNGKIYASLKMGLYEGSLIEISQKTGEVNTVLSPRAKNPNCKIDGQTVRCVAVDKINKKLLVGVAFKKPAENKGGLFLFDPQTKEVERIPPEKTSLMNKIPSRTINRISSIQNFPDFTIITSSNNVYMFSKKEKTIKALISSSEPYPAQWINKDDYSISYSKICYSPRQIITYGMNSGFFLWLDKKQTPIKIFPKVFTDVTNIYDIRNLIETPWGIVSKVPNSINLTTHTQFRKFIDKQEKK